MRDPDQFATALRRERTSAGLSQSELARRAGVEPSYVAHLEAARRHPSLKNLCTIADALGCSLDRLLPSTHEAP